MSSKSLRQVRIVKLQLAVLEEQKVQLETVVEKIKAVLVEGQTWMNSYSPQTDFATIIQTIENTTDFVIENCHQILLENGDRQNTTEKVTVCVKQSPAVVKQSPAVVEQSPTVTSPASMRPKTQKVHKKKQTTFSSAPEVVCTEQATQTDCEPTGSDVTNKETGIESAEPAHAPCESGPRNVDVCLWSGNNAICGDDRSSQVAALETKVLEQERRYRDLEEIVGKLQKKHEEEEDISQHGGTKTHLRNLKDTRNNKVNDNQPPLTCVEVNNVSATSFTKAPSLAPAVTACIPYGVSVDVFTGSVLTCFNDVVCNTGDQYDPVTGEFKATLDGLYLAFISLRQLGTGYICIDVMSRTRGAPRNERKVCEAHTLMPDTSASGLGVVQLREGDVIYLKGLQRGGAKLNMHSSFSCFMIR